MTPRPPTLLLLALSLNAPQLAAQPAGRLFYTPEQRAQLDTEKYRQLGRSAAIHYQGRVQRSQGPTTLWINGKPQSGSAPPGLQVGDRSSPNQALLQGGKIIIHPAPRP